MRRFFHRKHSKILTLVLDCTTFLQDRALIILGESKVIQLDVVVYNGPFTPLLDYHSDDSASRNDE